MIRKGAPPRRPTGGDNGGCNFVRVMTVGLFCVTLGWLALGISMFTTASRTHHEDLTVTAKLKLTEEAMVRRLRIAEEKLLHAAQHRPPPLWTSAHGAQDQERALAAAGGVGDEAPQQQPNGGDDATVRDHAAMGHDFGSAAKAAQHATPPPETGPQAAAKAAAHTVEAPLPPTPPTPALAGATLSDSGSGGGSGGGQVGEEVTAAAKAGGRHDVGWDQAAWSEFVWTTEAGTDKLPPFWAPPPGVELDSTGTFVNDQPTIYVMVAAYRDFQCRETVTSALSRATHPDRVVVGIVEQNSYEGEIDQSCVEPHQPCAKDPAQPLCSRKHQIRHVKIDAKSATGPVFARHVGDRMYRGEMFAMQLDAHVTFIKDWDEVMIDQLHETKNDYALLSTYLTDVQGSIAADGTSLRRTRPIMCNSGFEGGGVTSHLRHLAQPEEVAVMQDTPMLEPFWAAGMSFSRGHFITRVPYDCCLPMLFQGEEISIGIRAWTYGYDMYAPHKSVIFHEYAVNSARRRGVHSFWENRGAGNAATAMQRMVGLIKMAPDLNPKLYDHVDEDIYSTGTVRPVERFYELFGMDVKKKKIVPEMCKWVKSGAMHNAFVPALRPNGKGIDYTSFYGTFDAYAAVAKVLDNLRVAAEAHLTQAISKRKVAALAAALDGAKRARNVDAGLLEKARALMATLKSGG